MRFSHGFVQNDNSRQRWVHRSPHRRVPERFANQDVSSHTSPVNRSDARYVYQDRRVTEWKGPSFDRIGFAMRALSILRPQGMTVVVREGYWELRIDRGRAWDQGSERHWAVVSIPPHASREDIAVALARLAGAENDPYIMDLLLSTPDVH